MSSQDITILIGAAIYAVFVVIWWINLQKITKEENEAWQKRSDDYSEFVGFLTDQFEEETGVKMPKPNEV